MRRFLTLSSLIFPVFLFGCDGSQPTEPDTPAPSFEILDAVHDAGNPHFFWLPPMVKNPPFTGSFDPEVNPVVEICEWAGECVGTLTARFTMDATPESEGIRMVAEEEHYGVNWHAGALELSTDATYRIIVFLGPTELGFADLDLVSNMKEFRKIDTGEFIPLNDDGTLPIKFRIEEGALLEPAETILFNGHILTMDPEHSVAQAIAINGRLIQAVGPDREILRHARESTNLIDLNGQTLMPGIVEPHTHLLQTYDDKGWGMASGQAAAFRHGVTTIGEAWAGPNNVPAYEAFRASGNMKLKTSLYLVDSDNCGNDLGGDWWKSYPPTREFGEVLRYNGIKIFADGGSCGEPAASVPFYLDEDPLFYGDLYLTAEIIEPIVAEATALGYQVAVHAIGDEAVFQAMNGIEAGIGTTPSEARPRIEHNLVVPGEPPRDLLWRYSDIGIVPTVLHYLPLGWMDPKPAYCTPADRNPFYEAWEGNTRAMLDRNPGHPVAWHADYPYGAYFSPFKNLFSAITRIRRTPSGSECLPPFWQLKTVITVEEGLTMMTDYAAYALFRDEEVGSLEVGKLADMIVLSDNPLEGQEDPERIWNMDIWMTMVEGDVVYCLEGKEVYCGLPAAGS